MTVLLLGLILGAFLTDTSSSFSGIFLKCVLTRGGPYSESFAFIIVETVSVFMSSKGESTETPRSFPDKVLF